MDTYYVYAYLRKDGTPYYIGKGKDGRAFVKGKGEIGKPSKDRIIFVECGLTNIGALAIERRLIKWYGRKDLGTGILRNQTDGGDGVAGYTYTTEQRLAISKRQKGRKGKPHSDATKQKIREHNLGKHKDPYTEEHKRKISLALIGKAKTEEHSKNLSIALRGRVPGTIERENYLNAMEAGKTSCEYCGKIATKGNYIRWHGINCKTLLTGETPTPKD